MGVARSEWCSRRRAGHWGAVILSPRPLPRGPRGRALRGSPWPVDVLPGRVARRRRRRRRRRRPHLTTSPSSSSSSPPSTLRETKRKFCRPPDPLISMFSGARNSARGPSGKKQKPRAIARTLKLGGRGRRRAAGKLAFSFAGGCSKVCCAPPSAQLHLERMAHLARLAHWARLAHGASGAFVPPCAPRALGAPGAPSRAHRFPNLRCVYPRLLSHLAHLALGVAGRSRVAQEEDYPHERGDRPPLGHKEVLGMAAGTFRRRQAVPRLREVLMDGGA